jgi:hypothetical protein
MRIYGSSGPAFVGGAVAPKRAASGNFSLTESEAARGAGSASALRSVGGIDALIALQGVEDAA